MTGPAEGKLKLDATVYLSSDEEKTKLEGAVVYIHLKGYAEAKVTHLDIEHDLLGNIIPPKRGEFLTIKGSKGRIEIKLEKDREIEHKNKLMKVKGIEIIHPYLNHILQPGEKTRTWVGGKFGGIYIGFRKNEIEKLEEIAREKFKIDF